jgi:hypothetical protein
VKSIIKKFQILLVACATVSSLASSVIEDSKKHFVLDDEVMDSSKESCEDGSGMRFSPENAFYRDSVPFRHYRVALPSSEKPSVSVTNNKTIPLNAAPCKSTPVKAQSVSVSTPYMKDGLWVVDVLVPLYVKQGSSIALRKGFRLNVDFATASASGRNPGARALMHVVNKKSAASFGTAGVRNALRREASSEIDGVVQLAELVVGDKNMATFSEDGVYAVGFNAIRSALSKINRQDLLYGIPIEKLCIFGASPDTLPDMGPGTKLRNPDQLFELPIKVVDRNSNGLFDDVNSSSGDSIYFVGYGNAFWKRIDSEPEGTSRTGMGYFHSYSPYSYYQHFILGYKEVGSGLRIKTLEPPKSTPKNIEWLRYVRAEKDVYLRDTYYGMAQDWERTTGKEWFWEWHARNEETVIPSGKLGQASTIDLPGLVEGGTGYVSVSFFPYRSISGVESSISDYQSASLFSTDVYENRMKFIHFSFDVNGETISRKKGQEDFWYDGSLLPGGNFAMKFSSLKKTGNKYELTMLPNDKQYDRFDGYSVAYQWDPSTVSIDSSEWLLPGFATGVIRIPVGEGDQLSLMKFKNLEPVGLLKIDNGFAVDSIGFDDDVRYLLYRNDNRRKGMLSINAIVPPSENVVRNLANISSKTEYLIIAPDEFLAPAESLAVFRSSDKAASPLVTAVVSAENIYRHYTGGSASPIAIRNYIAYARSVCPDLRFVLLAGSGHYDYRGIDGHAPSYIPPFEKESSVTEDFFGTLDSGEVVRSGKSYDVDLAVGRLPVSSEREFFDYIVKAKDYDQIGTFDHGEWKSTLLLAADDARNGTEVDHAKHTKDQEELASLIDSVSNKLGFRMNLKKVYLLDYEYDAAGQKQDATNDFLNIMSKGALMTMYFGHGSKVAWASEGLLKPAYLSKLSNEKAYTVLNSFSCTVGRFDEGDTRSMSEAFVVEPKVGAIAAIGAARETFETSNVVFAKNFISRAVLENGIYLGEAYMLAKDNVFKESTKQSDHVYNSEHYVFMGEPVIRMPYANLKISLDNPVDSIKALDKMKLSGKVFGMSSGSIALTLREGRFNKRLAMQNSEGDTINVKYDGPLIYSEVVPVVGGRFETEFVTPKKLNIGDSLAELRAWAYSSKDVAVGRYLDTNIVISGVSDYADSLNDKTPPVITIQSCNSGTASSFADGQQVKLWTPACLQVIVEDETALDYREQADEGISFEMVGLENPYHPAPFLEQSSKRAVARKSLTTESYPPGDYVFKVRALDVLGNAATKTVKVQITESMQTGLSDVFNIPNPMGKKGTTFYFKDLAAGSGSNVTIFIYNQHGRLVKVIKDAKSGVTHWDGKDNYGRLLANGLYHYVVRSKAKVSVSDSKTKNKTWTKKQKLLISR